MEGREGGEERGKKILWEKRRVEKVYNCLGELKISATALETNVG